MTRAHSVLGGHSPRYHAMLDAFCNVSTWSNAYQCMQQSMHCMTLGCIALRHTGGQWRTLATAMLCMGGRAVKTTQLMMLPVGVLEG